MKKEKIILITGASDGLGLATSKMLIDKGYKVIGLCRTKPNDSRIYHISFDLTSEESMIKAAKEINKLKSQEQ